MITPNTYNILSLHLYSFTHWWYCVLFRRDCKLKLINGSTIQVSKPGLVKKRKKMEGTNNNGGEDAVLTDDESLERHCKEIETECKRKKA